MSNANNENREMVHDNDFVLLSSMQPKVKTKSYIHHDSRLTLKKVQPPSTPSMSMQNPKDDVESLSPMLPNIKMKNHDSRLVLKRPPPPHPMPMKIQRIRTSDDEERLLQLRRDQVADFQNWGQLEDRIQKLQLELNMVKERVIERKRKIEDLK